LLDSYFSVDAWPSLERAVRGTGPRVHFIIGERSKVFDVADRQRAGALTAEPAHRCTVDVLPTGHWVHVEDFEGTVRLINQRLG
jgi:pimeloyl-ACP methyl ester carboxylesterase